MRVKLLLAAVALAATCAQAQSGFTTLSASEVEHYITSYNGPQTRVAGWIYTDKYVYRPGDTITLKLTLKPNNDLYPYVAIAYRQDNQSGNKIYLPGNTEAVTDFNGNAQAQGFQPVQLTAVTKQTIATIQAPSELGMHTFVYELRDYTGTRVLKAMHMKIGVVNSVQTLSGDITSDRTLTNDTQWNLDGRVNVKNGATITIEPGTFIIGQPGPSVLLITRFGKINAKGTKSRPIIMTSSLPFGQRTRGDWGGIGLLGTSQVNVAAGKVGSNTDGTTFLEGVVDNDDSKFGGGLTPDLTHNCGTLEYVRVEYAGFILAPNQEINSFTFGGCGSDTVADHLQAIYGLDDTFEWFGGTMNAKYLVGGLSNDDYLDYQLGTAGKVQFLIGYQSPDAKGNRGVEGDNSEYDEGAIPFSNPTVFNATFIGSGTPGSDEGDNIPGIYLRRGSRGSFNNIVLYRWWSPGISISDANTQAQADLGNLKMNGILMFNTNILNNGANTLDGQLLDPASAPAAKSVYSRDFAAGQKGNGAGKNFVGGAAPLLARPFEYSDPDFKTLFASPVFRAGWVAPPDDGFFDQSAKFIGAMGDDDWTEEWTNFHTEQDVAP